MFVTTAEFGEEQANSSLLDLGLSTWGAVQIPTFCQIWFVVSFALPGAADELYGSVLVASELVLEELLSEASPLQALAVSAMALDHDGLSWRQHEVASVWKKEVHSSDLDSGGMVLSLKNDGRLRTFKLAEAKRGSKCTCLFTCA